MEANQKVEASNQISEETGLFTPGGQFIPVNVYAKQITIFTDKLGPVQVPFLDQTAIDYIAALITEKVKNGFDRIVMITGERRKGKSTLGLQIARKVSASFGIDEVAFRVDRFHEILHQNVYADPSSDAYPQAFLDEAGFDLYSKEWMAVWQRDLVKLLEIIGIKRQVCYFIMPHVKKLTGDIRDEMAHIWIDVDTKWQDKRGYAEVFEGERNKFKQLIWWSPQCAFKFEELKDTFWQEYETEKKKFVDEIAAEDNASRSGSKDQERVDCLISDMYRRGVSIEDLCEQTRLSRSQIFRRMQRYRLNIDVHSPPLATKQ